MKPVFEVFFHAVAMISLALPAFAQGVVATKPYEPLALSYDRLAAKDADLTALIARLKTAADAHDVSAIGAALSQDFVALDCSPSPLKFCAPGKTKALGESAVPLDRMRLAYCCEGKPASAPPQSAQNETLFVIVAASLASGSLSANPDAKGSVCTPALPAFDRKKLGKIAKILGVESENMRVATTQAVLREKPAAASPVAMTLAPGALAPIVTEMTANTPSGWTAIAMPKGGVGFTDALAFEEIAPGALCFGKAGDGWKVVYAVLRGVN